MSRRMQTAIENPFLNESGNGAMPKAKHLAAKVWGIQARGGASTVLGRLKQADLAAQMPARIMLAEDTAARRRRQRDIPVSSR